jgi:hypothetical protein
VTIRSSWGSDAGHGYVGIGHGEWAPPAVATRVRTKFYSEWQNMGIRAYCHAVGSSSIGRPMAAP